MHWSSGYATMKITTGDGGRRAKLPTVGDVPLRVRRGSVEYHETVASVMRDLPKFLIMRCDNCKRNVRVNGVDIEKHIERDKTSRVVLKGPCSKCEEILSEDITTNEMMQVVADRTQKFWERKQSRRKKDKTLTMAKTATKEKTAKKADKVAEKTEKMKKTKAAKVEAKATKSSKAPKDAKAAKASKKSSEKKTPTGDRQKAYIRSEGQPSQQQAFIMVAGGDFYTPQQIQERWEKLEKKGTVGKRNRPVEVIDLTFMTGPRVGAVTIDEKPYEMFMARVDGATVYGSTYKDLLGSKKPLKIKDGKAGKLVVAKNKKDLPS